MKPTVLIYDTKDDRREVWHLLHRLHPIRRVRFLCWCCEQVRLRGGPQHPEPSYRMAPLIQDAAREGVADERLTNAVYADVMVLGHQWRLDLDQVMGRLVEEVKGKDSRPLPGFRLSIPNRFIS